MSSKSDRFLHISVPIYYLLEQKDNNNFILKMLNDFCEK